MLQITSQNKKAIWAGHGLLKFLETANFFKGFGPTLDFRTIICGIDKLGIVHFDQFLIQFLIEKLVILVLYFSGNQQFTIMPS